MFNQSLISNSPQGMQAQLNGLFDFCSKNLMILNELKTKVMHFGNCESVQFHFNNKVIERVERYKYLGNMFSSICKINQDMFSDNYSYLSNQSRKAIYSIMGKTEQIGRLSPALMFEMFNTLVRPILLYGSEVWGINKKGTSDIDKVFLRYIRNVLCVKCTTSKIITVGESGQLPPSVYAHYHVLCYAERLSRMPSDHLARDVYEALKCL